MLLSLRRSAVISAVFLVLLGLAYPLAGTLVSQALFPFQANGSLVGQGSLLIGQSWTGPRWFQGRPDGSLIGTGPGGILVSGTNQVGPLSSSLEKFVVHQARRLEQEGIVPTNDLVTPSGSLVDPDISPASAMTQVASVAKARHLPVQAVAGLVRKETRGRELGFLGESTVNVLQLNVALSHMT
jgi:K+-transporting ATPase ATPase C chain